MVERSIVRRLKLQRVFQVDVSTPYVSSRLSTEFHMHKYVSSYTYCYTCCSTKKIGAKQKLSGEVDRSYLAREKHSFIFNVFSKREIHYYVRGAKTSIRLS